MGRKYEREIRDDILRRKYWFTNQNVFEYLRNHGYVGGISTVRTHSARLHSEGMLIERKAKKGKFIEYRVIDNIPPKKSKTHPKIEKEMGAYKVKERSAPTPQGSPAEIIDGLQNMETKDVDAGNAPEPEPKKGSRLRETPFPKFKKSIFLYSLKKVIDVTDAMQWRTANLEVLDDIAVSLHNLLSGRAPKED